MTELGKYLYCIVRCSGERIFEDVAPIGDADGPVHTVSHDGLTAVVNDSHIRDYDATRTNVLTHERVQERVMREFTLLPVRFGSVTKPGDPVQQIRKLLAKKSQEFDRLLTDMEGKTELGLKALWRDEQAIFGELLAENPSIRRLRDSLRRKRPEVVRFEGVSLGEKVKEALESKKSRETVNILAALRSIARRTRENDVVVDRMLFNTAFLVERSREGEFDDAVARLDERWGHRTDFRYTGPNPPWNFVEVVVSWEEL